MKFLVDMNLSPLWCKFLIEAGFESEHWSDVGLPDAPDEVIFTTALKRGSIVFTHDLDFGSILALTGAKGPSVVQLREQDVDPQSIGMAVIEALRQCEEILEKGAIVTIDLRRAKARFLPIR